MYACMYVCMYVCMYTCMPACMHACMYVCMCIYIERYRYYTGLDSDRFKRPGDRYLKRHVHQWMAGRKYMARARHVEHAKS